MIIRNLSKFLLLSLLLFALSEAFSHILCKSEQYPYVRLTEQEKTLLQSLAKGLHADKTTCVQETATLTPAELEDYRLQIRIIEALSPTTEEEAYIKVLMDRTGTSTLDQLQEKLGLKERKNFIRKVLEKIGLIREKPSTAALSQYSLEVNQATIDLLNKLKAPLAQKSFFTELRERVGCAADATLDDLKTKVDSWLESGKEKLATVKEKTVEGAETIKEKAEEKLGTLKERTVQGAETVAEKIKGAGEQGIDALKEKSEALKQKAKETFEDAKEKMNAAAETVKEKKDELQEKAACAGETVKETVMEGAETIKEKAMEGAETIKEKAAEGAEAVKETVEKTQHAAADWLKEKAETVKEGFQRAKDKTEQLKEAGAEKVKGIICEENAKSPNCPGYGL